MSVEHYLVDHHNKKMMYIGKDCWQNLYNDEGKINKNHIKNIELFTKFCENNLLINRYDKPKEVIINKLWVFIVNSSDIELMNDMINSIDKHGNYDIFDLQDEFQYELIYL